MNETERHLLRHFLATLAYRTQKALRDAPEEFAEFTPVAGVRTPHHLLSHMSDVLSFARARAEDISYPLPNTDTFEEEQARFFSILESLSDCLER
ncbi:MAG: hypothetical protein HKN21_16700, partial [Candidatus Eisenbacteria bacterium]|nr:hypothetical protein [Candidatus Eisenbacteria bacterium]